MTRPRIRTEGTLLPGLAAIALFVLMAAVFLSATVTVTASDEGAFQTQPKVINVSLDDGETAAINHTNTSTVLDVRNADGALVTQVPVDENASAAATVAVEGDTATVTVEKYVGIAQGLGVALLNLQADQAGAHPRVESARMAAIESEGFLLAFELIDLVLVAALVAAVMLARREHDGEVVSVGSATSRSADTEAVADGGESE